MQNSRLRASLCVSAVLLASLLAGVYSTVVEPTQTNTRTVTLTTEGLAYSERTYLYTMASMNVATLRTLRTSVTRYLTSCTYSCYTGNFHESIVVTRINAGEETLRSVCIVYGPVTVYNGQVFLEIEKHYHPQSQCVTVTKTSYAYSLSSGTLTLTSTIIDPSVPVYFTATVTEPRYETLPNPQKLELQSLTVVLLLVAAAGIGLAIARMRGATPPRDETRIYGGPEKENPISGWPETPSAISMPPRCPRCGGILTELGRADWICSRCNAAMERVGHGWELRTNKRA